MLPMHPHQSGDEKLVTQFFVCVVGGYVGDGVVEEKGIAGWSVDCSVEDVADYFALFASFFALV